jgi:predicted  nucleic acid-binding Zn-ribbon protein
MNSSKIMVNGALMEKEFFDENVNEAKTYSWVEKPMATIADHAHCIVCTIALPNSQSDRVFASGNILLCDHCYRNYLK